jgi:hypothetical protein
MSSGSSSAENSTPSTEGQVSLVLTFSRVSVASCASLISFGPLPWFNWILSNFYWHFECCLTNWKAVVGPILYSPAHFLVSEQALTPHLEQDLHVIILPEYLTSNNDALRNEDIWGSNPYSTDSDAVCILQHSGLYNVLDSSISDDMVGLKVVLRIHPGNTDMPGTERGGIKSKPGSAKFACLSALQFSILRDAESAAIVEQLKRSPSFGPLRPSAVASVEGNPNAMNVSAPETSSTAPGAEPSSSATAPGLDTSAPGTVPSIHIAATGATPISAATASSSSGAVKRSTRRHHRRHVEEVDSRVSIDVLPDTILQFNLSNELAFQYNLNLICDRGIEPSQWTSHRLRNAVLMIETLHKRYELSWEQEAHPHTATNAQFDTYRFALVKTPSSKTRAWHTSHQVPLDSDNATVVHKGLDWSQLIWGPASLTILSNIYSLRRIFWIARATPPVAPVSTSADPKPTGTNGS